MLECCIWPRGAAAPVAAAAGVPTQSQAIAPLPPPPPASHPHQAVVRGWFAVAVRYANAASAAILALFPQGWLHRGPRAAGPEHPEAWRRWWASAAGTFNYVLEREGLAGPATPRTPRPASASSRRGRGGSSGAAANGGQTEVEVEDEASSGGALARQSQQQQQQQQQRRQAQSGWFSQRRRGDRSATPSPAPSPTPRPALAAKTPHPASSRRRGPASLARMSPGMGLQRGDALFELPAGFAIQEGLPQHGLLEEAALAMELAVSRVFDAFRAAVRVLLFLSTPPDERQSPAELLRAQLHEEEAAAGRGARRRASSRGAASAAASDAGSEDLSAPPRAAEHEGEAEGGEEARRSYSRASSVRWRSPLESMGSVRHWEDLHVWTASDVILRAG